MRRMLFLCNAIALLPAIANAQPCHRYDYALAFIKSEYDMLLISWGMTQDGNSMELWLADDGHFATLTTTPGGCTMVAMPEHLHDRLRQPPQRNRAIPIQPLDRGDAL